MSLVSPVTRTTKRWRLPAAASPRIPASPCEELHLGEHSTYVVQRPVRMVRSTPLAPRLSTRASVGETCDSMYVITFASTFSAEEVALFIFVQRPCPYLGIDASMRVLCQPTASESSDVPLAKIGRPSASHSVQLPSNSVHHHVVRSHPRSVDHQLRGLWNRSVGERHR